MKKCAKCGVEKLLQEFNKDKHRKDGHCHLCKVCHRLRSKKWNQDNPEYRKKYVEKNRDKINERRRKRYSENPEHYLEYNKKYCLSPEKKREYQQQRYSKNPEYFIAQQEKHRSKQPACIYKIVNSITNKIYIGQTLNGKMRWTQHLSALKNNRHHVLEMQKDYDEYGKEVFEWFIIETMKKDKILLEKRENEIIKQYSEEGKKLYNTFSKEEK